MSYSTELRAELERAGIRGAHAERIVAEFEDHLACDPNARLGTPREIAERFAAELCVIRTRRATAGMFAALALCGALFLVVVATHRGSGFPSWVSAIGALAAIASAQIAFVAGMLALVRVLRGRSAGDLRVAQRRGAVALAAGTAVAIALAATGAFYVLVVLPALVFATRASRAAATITPHETGEGLAADVPFPRLTLLLLGGAATGITLLQGVVGEKSVQEGLIRGGIEAIGLTLGVLVFGRVLGLRPIRAR